jgi:hypothetical protein
MLDGSQHAKHVDDWLGQVPKDIAWDELLGRFELMFAAVWGRAHQTLGEVTLTAILDRVLYLAAEQHPFVAELEVQPRGLRCRKLLGRGREFEHDEVVAAIRFVVVEFLTLLGNLTAEIMTPALHAELAGMVEHAGDGPHGSGPTRPKITDDQGSKS